MRFIFTIILCFIISVVSISASHATESQNAIGKISYIKGSAKRLPQDQDQKPVTLILGNETFLHDKIRAGKDSIVKIDFIDETEITLGTNTVLTIDKYIFDPDATSKNSAKYSLLKGAFHYASGLIAKKEKTDVTLELDFGSIGIRGTKIWRDMTIDETTGKRQCRIYLEDGKAKVFNERGYVMLEHGDGTRIVGNGEAPTRAKPWGEANITAIKSKTALAEQ